MAIVPISTCAQNLTLRDFSIVESPVSSMDIDGVHLEDSTSISWDQVFSCDFENISKQKQFEKFQKEIGVPLLRIKTRLKNHDDGSLKEISQQMAGKLAGRNSQSEFIANCGLFYGLLHEGEREQAAVVLIKCMSLLEQTAITNDLPADRSIDFNAESGINNNLLPLWFNADAAEKAWLQIKQENLVNPESPEGILVYAISLAIAGDSTNQEATDVSILFKSDTFQESRWSKIIQAQQLLSERQSNLVSETLPLQITELEMPLKCSALYYKGLAGIDSEHEETRKAALLDLLKIPAELGDVFPEVAAAAIYHAIGSKMILENSKSAQSLRQELLTKFARTHFGRKLEKELKR